MRHYLSLITVAVLHVSAKWRTAHHLTKGKSRMFELVVHEVSQDCLYELCNSSKNPSLLTSLFYTSFGHRLTSPVWHQTFKGKECESKHATMYAHVCVCVRVMKCMYLYALVGCHK